MLALGRDESEPVRRDVASGRAGERAPPLPSLAALVARAAGVLSTGGERGWPVLDDGRRRRMIFLSRVNATAGVDSDAAVVAGSRSSAGGAAVGAAEVEATGGSDDGSRGNKEEDDKEEEGSSKGEGAAGDELSEGESGGGGGDGEGSTGRSTAASAGGDGPGVLMTWGDLETVGSAFVWPKRGRRRWSSTPGAFVSTSSDSLPAPTANGTRTAFAGRARQIVLQRSRDAPILAVADGCRWPGAD